jgi:hypothetical protein
MVSLAILSNNHTSMDSNQASTSLHHRILQPDNPSDPQIMGKFILDVDHGAADLIRGLNHTHTLD